MVDDRKIMLEKFIRLEKIVKKLNKAAKVILPLGAIALGAYLIDKALERYDIDPENPKGFEVCYLSEEDEGLPVTRADVDCDRVEYFTP